MMIVVLIATVSVLGFYFYQKNAMIAETQENMGKRLEDINTYMQADNEKIKELKAELNAQFIIKANSVSFAIEQNPSLITNKEKLSQLAKLIDVEEIHITDEKGVLLWGTVPDFYGFDFSTSEQTKPFLLGLKDSNFQMAQEPQRRGADNVLFQYITVARKDKAGLVQVGVEPKRLSQALEKSEVKNISKLYQFGTTGKIIVVDKVTDLVVSHPEEKTLGQKSETLAFAKSIKSTNGLIEFSDAGKINIGSYKTFGDYVVVAAIERDEVTKQIEGMVGLVIFAALAIVLICMVVLYLLIKNYITAPISKLVIGSKLIAEGNLNVAFDIRSKDEIGALAEAFSEMANKVNEILHEIDASAGYVASGADHLASSSQVLSEGATHQALAVESIMSSIQGLASQARVSLTHSQSAKTLADQVDETANIANQKMDTMLVSMTEINDSSQNISRIIKVIDGIAFQTNILALNAAVEAARAGQQGKGFTVVAEEVRNLAARSAQAAKETADLIEGSVQKVAIGTQLAKDTSESLKAIADVANKMVTVVSEITTATQAQATDLISVESAIESVSDVVQNNTATAEESAAESQELSSQAELLKELVATFKLKSL